MSTYTVAEVNGHKMNQDQDAAYRAGLKAMALGDYRTAIKRMEASGAGFKKLPAWHQAMAKYVETHKDPFDTVINESALATIKLGRKSGTRAATFVTSKRGIEGPLANLILGGGTSMLGS